MKSRARVLVVDDEALMRRMVRSILVKEGYFVAQSSDVLDALGKLSKARFDIVISDICMPDSDGFELLAAIKDRYPDTAVVVMTGFGDVCTPDKARELGADEYITKPFNAREIAVIVERVRWRGMVAKHPPSLKRRFELGGILNAQDAAAGTPSR